MNGFKLWGLRFGVGTLKMKDLRFEIFEIVDVVHCYFDFKI